jgi:hypothetical protein
MIVVVAIDAGVEVILAISVMAMSLTLKGVSRDKNNPIDAITVPGRGYRYMDFIISANTLSFLALLNRYL